MVIKFVPALFFALFLTIGGVLSLLAVFKAEIPDANPFRGELTAQYETAFDESLNHRPLGINLMNKVNSTLFKEGRKGVLIGTDGWLFTDEEFVLPPEYKENIEENKNYIRSVKTELDTQNIKLFVIPIPAKARLFQDMLGRYDYPMAWQGHYKSFLAFLREEGIAANQNLQSVLSKPEAFLKNDTHWTPQGARITAMNTALNLEEYYPYLSWTREDFKSEKTGMIPHEGDLTRYTIKQSENLDQWQTISSKEEDLFGDKDYAVALIGTSYSANLQWNFDGFLKEALSTDILNMSDEGLGPFQVMKNYLASKTYKQDKPKLIIWEMPERYLPIHSKEKT